MDRKQENPSSLRLNSLVARNTQKKFSISLLEGNKFNFCADERPSILIVVTSTFGSGGHPANISRFIEKLEKRQQAMHLRKFAVFGLGCSTYPMFNGCAKRVNELVSRLTSSTAFAFELADETLGEDSPFISFNNKVIGEIMGEIRSIVPAPTLSNEMKGWDA